MEPESEREPERELRRRRLPRSCILKGVDWGGEERE